MPCYDSRNDHVASDILGRLDRVTAVACELAKFYRAAKEVVPEFYVSPDTAKWMAEHEEWDQRRRSNDNKMITRAEINEGVVRVLRGKKRR